MSHMTFIRAWAATLAQRLNDARNDELTATEQVDTIVTPAVEVLIRPKIPVENLFLLMDVYLLPVAWGTLPYGYAPAEDLLAAFAMLFTRTLDRAVGNGLVRVYRSEAERLMAILVLI